MIANVKIRSGEYFGDLRATYTKGIRYAVAETLINYVLYKHLKDFYINI